MVPHAALLDQQFKDLLLFISHKKPLSAVWQPHTSCGSRFVWSWFCPQAAMNDTGDDKSTPAKHSFSKPHRVYHMLGVSLQPHCCYAQRTWMTWLQEGNSLAQGFNDDTWLENVFDKSIAIMLSVSMNRILNVSFAHIYHLFIRSFLTRVPTAAVIGSIVPPCHDIVINRSSVIPTAATSPADHYSDPSSSSSTQAMGLN